MSNMATDTSVSITQLDNRCGSVWQSDLTKTYNQVQVHRDQLQPVDHLG